MITHPNLKLWVKHDGNVLDASGNGRNGSTAGLVYVAGIIGRAGQYSSGIATSLPLLNVYGNSKRTIAAWINIPDNTSNRWILSMGVGTYTQFHFHISGNVPAVHYNSTIQTAPVNLQINTWYHVAVAFSGGIPGPATVKFFVNGVKYSGSAPAGAVTLNTSNDTYYCGNHSNGLWPIGKINELQLYDIDLDQSDIIRIMQGLHPLKRG